MMEWNCHIPPKASQKARSKLCPLTTQLPSLACLIGFSLPPTRLSLARGKYHMVGFSPLAQEGGRLGDPGSSDIHIFPVPRHPWL